MAAVAAAGCGSDGGDRVDASSFTVEGKFDVGGHELFIECRGSGSPTVVYLHGSVQTEDEGGRRNAEDIPSLLEDRYRFCAYDRANVGLSDSVGGPLTGEDSARDLHALLRAADVPGPYVLLGGSLGGAIADIYAASYPEDVAGMVLLDSSLPAYLDMYKRLFPPGAGPQPGDWKREAEKLDKLTTFRQAGTFQQRRARIPATYIGISAPAPPKVLAAIRDAQRAFVNRFSPGRLIVLDVPHYMEPVIPDRIAGEVERVIAAGRR
ncbi:MAG: alpha/beta hydrolase [Gaiellaceae bacterium MAG52_C11]|nr:alpha/beta hydrolase [Candidatus Gaiellasilicea maunaloa]